MLYCYVLLTSIMLHTQTPPEKSMIFPGGLEVVRGEVRGRASMDVDI